MACLEAADREAPTFCPRLGAIFSLAEGEVVDSPVWNGPGRRILGALLCGKENLFGAFFRDSRRYYQNVAVAKTAASTSSTLRVPADVHRT